jgi:DNA-binding CsgD family transcriptional regulator
MITDRVRKEDAGMPPLSPREAEVLEAASLGLTNAEIGARLRVSVHAVKFHLAGIYRKLAVTNRTEAVGVYLRGAGLRGEPGTID